MRKRHFVIVGTAVGAAIGWRNAEIATAEIAASLTADGLLADATGWPAIYAAEILLAAVPGALLGLLLGVLAKALLRHSSPV